MMRFLIFLFFVSNANAEVSVTNLGQCEMTYLVAANAEASKLLTKKFDFSVAEVAVLLSNENYNKTVLDLLIGYSQLVNKERIKGQIFEDLARAIKTPDYHETNTDDEQAALMISLPAADLWPVDLNSIVQKTRLINDVLQNRDVTISRPAFELLVAVISQYNYHEKYAPAFSHPFLYARKSQYLMTLNDKERKEYFTAQIQAFPQSMRRFVAILDGTYSHVSSGAYQPKGIGNFYALNINNLKSLGALDLVRGRMKILHLAFHSKTDSDFLRNMLDYLGEYGKKSGSRTLNSFMLVDSNLQTYLAKTKIKPRTWKEWSEFYDSEFKPGELEQIGQEGGKISQVYFDVEKEYFLRLVKPVNLGNIDGKGLHDEIDKMLRRKLRELKSIAQFELDYEKLAAKETDLQHIEDKPLDFVFDENQVTYLTPQIVDSQLDGNAIAKNADVMGNLIASYGVNEKIGKEIAQHFLIRDEKFRRIFLKTFIKLIEGRGALIPLGTKKMVTGSGDIYEFNRLGSYRLFFAFHNHKVVLLHIDDVKNGQTLANQQRAIELSSDRFIQFQKLAR